MAHDARFFERGANVHSGRKDAPAAEACGELLIGFNAILQRHHDGVLVDGRREIVEDRLSLLRLDADEDEIRASAVGGTRIHRDTRDLDVTNQIRLDAQPARSQRLEVRSSRNEVDITAGARE